MPLARTTALIAILLPAAAFQVAGASDDPVEALRRQLEAPHDDLDGLLASPLASRPLSKAEAERATAMLWADHAARIRNGRADEMKARLIVQGELKMPFYYRTFGAKPASGRSLFISMHGGGGAPKAVNDSQWENQKRLYQLNEGVYLVPRAPTDTWNLWHQAHIDAMFSRLIENMIVFEDVDPDRVYLMGYSAGGDGVFQLAPRMADQLAAAAMMAGHPNETSPLGLRNLPFTLHMGGRDAAYNRNKIAQQWKEQLAQLQQQDPDGYTHLVKIYPDKGHWMDREDASAIPWMAKFERRRLPERIVWKQDDVRHSRFYWLAAPADAVEDRALVTARRDGQRIDVDSDQVERLTVRLSDEMLDLDRPVTIRWGERPVHDGTVARTIGSLVRTLQERGDPRGMFPAEVTVGRP